MDAPNSVAVVSGVSLKLLVAHQIALSVGVERVVEIQRGAERGLSGRLSHLDRRLCPERDRIYLWDILLLHVRRLSKKSAQWLASSSYGALQS